MSCTNMETPVVLTLPENPPISSGENVTGFFMSVKEKTKLLLLGDSANACFDQLSIQVISQAEPGASH